MKEGTAAPWATQKIMVWIVLVLIGSEFALIVSAKAFLSRNKPTFN